MEETFFKHATALVESENIGSDTRIWAFAHVLKGARIGKRCNLGDHVFVESNVRIGDDVTIKNGVAVWDCVTIEDKVFVGPNAVFTNDKNPRIAFHKTADEFLPTVVREGASIGANVTIVCGVEIGRHAFIGAGAVVTKDVEDHAIMIGNPARKVGYMCECGNKISSELTCECGRTYVHDGKRVTAATQELALKANS
jgi:UDP-2-acetamido-3-amino-2,3-dideoxy-glucuronate N-acetyltransferase